MAGWPHATSNILGKTDVEKHRIILSDGMPIKSQACHISPFKKKIIEEHVDKMLKDHIIEPLCSPWVSPVVLVPKPDGSYRFCVDYRKLTSKTVDRRLPHASCSWHLGVYWRSCMVQHPRSPVRLLAVPPLPIRRVCSLRRAPTPRGPLSQLLKKLNKKNFHSILILKLTYT